MNNFSFHHFRIRIGFAIILSFFLLAVSIPANGLENSKIEVKGLVRDAHTKRPINAVQISTLDKKFSATTDEDGKFLIRVSSLMDVLVITAFDYNEIEIPVKGRESITINLYSDKFINNFKMVDEPAGPKRTSNSVSSANSLTDFSLSAGISADEMMKSFGGDVRSISRSGIEGSGASLFIRGINSLNANAQPLFVVDGVMWNNLYDATSIHGGFFSNTLDDIDMNDIESITVLKDGTSIYGSKASNGVVLINTKRGKSMVTKINLNIYTGQQLQPKKLPLMNSDQFRIYASDLLRTQGVTSSDASNYGFLETDPSNAQTYNMYHNNTDWSKEVYHNGSTQNYNVSVRGGDEKALYYFSVGYAGGNEVVKNASFERINSRFNANLNLVRNLTMGINIAYTQVGRNSFEDGVSEFSPTWLSKIKAPFESPYSFTSTGAISKNYEESDIFGVGNPTAILEYYDVNNAKNFRYNLGFSPSYKITPEFTLSSMFDYSLDKTSERRFIPEGYTPEVYLEKYNVYSTSEINSQVMRNTAIFDDTRLTYQKKFGNWHNLQAIWGWRYLINYYEAEYAEGHNSGSNTNTTLSKSLDYQEVDGVNDMSKSISNYINVDYNFDDRYFATATLSVDGSSRFGKETESGFSLFGRSWAVFPSLSAGWKISSEKFMEKVNFVDFLKLRAGYGLTGNDGIQDYASLAYFATIQFMSKGNGLVISNLQNSKIQWETTAKSNAGLDFALFNNRLTGSFDVYSSKTSNLLISKELPDVTGLGEYWTNSGSMTNQGFEASLNLKVLNLRDLKWELGLGIGHYKNKITSLPNGDYVTSVYDGEVLTSVGNPAGVFYGYKTNGVFATNAAAEAASLKVYNTDGSYSSFQAGDVNFKEVKADGIIDENDKQIIGDPNPDFYGSISTKVTIKKLAISALFSYSYGNDVYNYTRSLLEAGSDYANQTTAILRRWTAEGQITSQPKAYYGDPMGNNRFSDRWIEDGSYIRLKTLSVSYPFPIKSNFIDGFTLWASANNLVTFTKYLGVDPEFSPGNSIYYQGVDAGLLSSSKSFFLGVNINL